MINLCDALRDLEPFAQIKKENKCPATACKFTKSSTPP